MKGWEPRRDEKPSGPRVLVCKMYYHTSCCKVQIPYNRPNVCVQCLMKLRWSLMARQTVGVGVARHARQVAKLAVEHPVRRRVRGYRRTRRMASVSARRP